jgi:hypothetical protein
MKMLVVNRLNNVGLCLKPLSKLESIEEIVSWQKVIKKVVVWGYLNRTIRIITKEPQKWSLGQEFLDSKIIIVEKIPYLISSTFFCNLPLLEKISESEDFLRGLLWLIDDNINDIKEEISNLNDTIKLDNCANTQVLSEILICLEDGESLYWINPKMSFEEIYARLKEIATSLSFGCSSI